MDLKSDFMYRLEQDQELQKIQEAREALPVKNFESEILDAIHHNSVVIRGATGCDKTTQVPQYILDLSSPFPASCNDSFLEEQSGHGTPHVSATGTLSQQEVQPRAQKDAPFNLTSGASPEKALRML
ncbi:ATP-dependent RNA helicase A-like isoform X2 [Catharus ustulatus]|uniref:ATP-dependent RNA helicase A-like isoform X2 n=1 Tax=Catharus ustulatus TaxID=91951 RepID=UPI00140B6439|nr:ATP-dependent RNA helicase A-like isoform X2 [Catharus ustulatus]